jgi:hypothetical protein
MCNLRQLGNALAQKEAIPVNSPGRRQKESRVRGVIPIIPFVSQAIVSPIGSAASKKPFKGRVRGKSLRHNGSTEHKIEEENPKHYSVENTTTSKSDLGDPRVLCT